MSVKVGCRVINGLTINFDSRGFYHQIKLNGPPMHGDVAFDAQGRQVKMGNADNHMFNSTQSPRGPYGVTTIEDIEWQAIQRIHADTDWFKRGMVFRI